MKIVKGLLGGLLALTLASAAVADIARIPLSAETTQLELIAQGDDALHFRADFGSLELERVSTPAGDFTRLSLPGYYLNQRAGAPALPMLNRLIELPLGADYTVEILSTQVREVDLALWDSTSP